MNPKNFAALYDVWLNNGTRITVWAMSEDDALQIARTFGLHPIGVGAV